MKIALYTSIALSAVALTIFIVCIVKKCLSKNECRSKNAWALAFAFAAAAALQFCSLYVKYGDNYVLWIFMSIIEAISMIGVHVSDEAKAFALSGVLPQATFIIVYVVFIIATATTVLDILGRKLINKIKIKFMVNKSHDIVIGNSPLSDVFIKSVNKKSTIIVLNEVNDQKFKELLNMRYVVINDKLDEKLLTYVVGNKAKAKAEVNIAVMCKNDGDSFIVSQKIADLINSRMEVAYTQEGKNDKVEIKRDCNVHAYVNYSKMDRLKKIEQLKDTYGKMTFFNQYDVRARNLFMNYPVTQLIPQEWIDYKKAKLISPKKIGNVFVGFGESNKQVLYKSLANNYFIGCDYSALVFTQVSDYEDTLSFQKQINSILYRENNDEYLPLPKEKFTINFKTDNIFSTEFEKALIKYVIDNDFVTIYIALGDDKLANECRSDIDLLLKQNNITDKSVIFTKIADYQSLGSEQPTSTDRNIYYGDLSKDITRESLFNKTVDKIARKIHAYYKIDKKIAVDAPQVVLAWSKIGDLKRDSNRYSALSIPVKLELMGLCLKTAVSDGYREVEEEEYLNILKGEEAKRADIENSSLDGEGNYLDCARNNLAELEHARWNAFYFSRGWTQMPKADIAKLTDTTNDEELQRHSCLTTIKGLRECRSIRLRKDKNAGVIDVKDMTEKEIKICKENYLDVINFDYQVMDNLCDILKESDYKICIKKTDERFKGD